MANSQLRKLYFLVPGTSGAFRGGGLFAEIKTMALAQEICETTVVTYRQREAEHPFLTDLLSNSDTQNCAFVIGWGFDTPKVLKQLKSHHVIYHAHSSGYGFRIPASVPIITVSRNTLGYWGQWANNGLLYHLPNEISPEFSNNNIERTIDVLVQARKSSQYLLKQLIPALQAKHNVYVLDHFVEDLPGLFNQTKIYLYDSAEYWAISGVTEGFGLPPLEAMACGCQVFSSVNHGLSDFLDPGFNCQKIGGYSLEYDLQRVGAAVRKPKPVEDLEELLAGHRRDRLLQRCQVILTEINAFFDYQEQNPQPKKLVPGLDFWRLKHLWLESTLGKIQKKLGR